MKKQILTILSKYNISVNIKMNAVEVDGKLEHFVALGKQIYNEELVEELVMLTFKSKTEQIVPCKSF